MDTFNIIVVAIPVVLFVFGLVGRIGGNGTEIQKNIVAWMGLKMPRKKHRTCAHLLPQNLGIN